jgi:adenosylcobinamide kinase/adenosylcobinamide-phosphate guanylyltransferase
VEDPDLVTILTSAGPPLLVDSLGGWLTGRLDEAGCWTDRPGWAEQVRKEIGELVTAWRQAVRPVVAVTEEVGWGVVPATTSGERFRDLLTQLNQRICEESERVLLVVAGRVLDLDTGPGDAPSPQPEENG